MISGDTCVAIFSIVLVDQNWETNLLKQLLIFGISTSAYRNKRAKFGINSVQIPVQTSKLFCQLLGAPLLKIHLNSLKKRFFTFRSFMSMRVLIKTLVALGNWVVEMVANNFNVYMSSYIFNIYMTPQKSQKYI